MHGNLCWTWAWLWREVRSANYIHQYSKQPPLCVHHSIIIIIVIIIITIIIHLLFHCVVLDQSGSDAPIESCCPFTGMHDAILRQSKAIELLPADNDDDHESDRDDASGSGAGSASAAVFRAEECLSFSEALWMYTIGAAFAANCEHVLGQVRAMPVKRVEHRRLHLLHVFSC
jgi:hypothetical protein